MKRRSVLGWLGVAPVVAVAGTATADVAKPTEPELYFIETDAWYDFTEYTGDVEVSPLTLDDSIKMLIENVSQNNAVLDYLTRKKS